MPAAEAVKRFAADLAALGPIDGDVGLAVSGGPDSLALLLLAHAALGARCRASTVDHRLRAEAAGEAAEVAAICAGLGVTHDTLTVEWAETPTTNIQAAARQARYKLLGQWALDQRLGAVLVAHHADDQAETLLMRLARGSGVAGLAGARAKSILVERDGTTVWRLRPLLGWRRADLGGIVASARLDPIDDPANRDPRFDRSRVRALLGANDWADPLRLAAAASHLADADEALRFAVNSLAAERISVLGRGITVDVSGLPRELKRRLLLTALDRAGERPPRGPDIERLLATLEAGGAGTLGSVKLIGGSPWQLEPAPPRRRDC
ncbi:MAG: tRNA lysidine(34) synthetase TilS [Pseudomonadota bacterium]|nr:tRNA lysidine(34) synthetase TilS [Pseudomonadota bacterium]